MNENTVNKEKPKITLDNISKGMLTASHLGYHLMEIDAFKRHGLISK
jgi:hypothetical protein